MAGTFEVDKDNAGKFRFRLKAANGQIVAQSQSYTTGDGAASGAKAVIGAALGAPIMRHDLATHN